MHRSRPKPFRVLLFTLLLCSAPVLQAQLFNGMNYQAVLRDAQGDPITDQAVTLTFDVRQGSAAGPLVFSDTHATGTNDRGLVNVVIGKGTVSGDLADLDFAGTSYYLLVSVDGSPLPAQRLEAVPMSYKATDMQLSDLTDVDGATPTTGQVLQWNGSAWVPGTAAGGGSYWVPDLTGINHSGAVGIGGVAAPDDRLIVYNNDSTHTSAVYAENNYHGVVNGFGMRSQATMMNDGLGVGLFGQAVAVGAAVDSVIGTLGFALNLGTGAAKTYGVYGLATNNTGLPQVGVHGRASGPNGVGVFGQNLTGQAGWFKGPVGVDDLDPAAITPDPSAVFQVQSYSRGVLLPRMPSASRTLIPSPAEGLLVYDTDLHRTMQFRLGAWEALGASTSPWAVVPDGITYSGNVAVGASPLSNTTLRVLTGTGDNVGIDVVSNWSGVGGGAKYGLSAVVTAAASTNLYGVRGEVYAPNIYGAPPIYGVFGKANQSPSNGTTIIGVYGEAGSGAALFPSYGVYGKNTGPYGAAVYGYNTDPSGNAGLFVGDVTLQGSASELHVGDLFVVRPTGVNSSPVLELSAALGAAPTVRLQGMNSASGAGGIWVNDINGLSRIMLKVDDSGVGRVTTDELEITGGSDLAELFAAPAETTIVPGTVVTIDPATQGIRPSEGAYDRLVVGVVSGARGIRPGMRMGQDGTVAHGDVPVAIAGRVYVRCSLANGPIAAGDLLTSAHEPGMAMKATDREASWGAIIGKALSVPDAGGFVLALIDLH
ncbi:MAG: hypothetical protein H6595_10135 [Flavobacteriales bacterium]|nr:hypothetical protein [Flavobacteriales bacterium]MCB9167820.1 hypothetical protein [Flavobacteriales bacterium]